MKKTLFIFGSLEALAGILLLSAADLLKNILPLLGRVAFQAAMAGSYSARDYELNITLPVLLALLLITAGAAQILLALVKKP